MPQATAKRPKSPLHSAKDERPPVSGRERKETEQLYAAFRRGEAKLVAPSGKSRSLPDSLHSFLVDLIGLINEGKSVIIVQDQAKLTTVEAAALLGVSRQFLVNLLERREIPHHMVGTHRRLYAQDLFQYKAQRDANRREAIRDLARGEAEEGLYDREPSAGNED